MFSLHCFPISIFWISAFTIVRAPSENSASFSRLGSGSGVCFVGVTGISNRSGSRLDFDSGLGWDCGFGAWDGALFSRLELVLGLCFVGVTGVSNRCGSRLEFGFAACVFGVRAVSNRNAFRLEIESELTLRWKVSSMASRSGWVQMAHLREWRSGAGSMFICLSIGATHSDHEFGCGFRRKPLAESRW